MRKIVIGLLALVSVPASAQCVWNWDCSNGQCVQVPICRSTLDIVPPKPAQLPPLPPLRSLKPLEPLTLPPLGTRSCQQRYICSGGQCSWQTVCQ